MTDAARMRGQLLHWLGRKAADARRDPLTVLLVVSSIVIGVVALIIIDLEFAPTPEPEVALSYGDFKNEVRDGHVKDVWTDGSTVEGDLNVAVRQTDGLRKGKAFITKIPGSGDPGLVNDLATAGVDVNPPRISFIWDFIASAPAFSTLSAVLAGFVIVAIVAILTFDPKTGDVPKHVPLPALLTAFLSLVVAAFLYAVVAGSRMAAGVDLGTHAEGFCLSWILAIGVIQTSSGIAWMLKAYEMPPNVIRVSVWIFECAVVVAAVSTSGLLVLPLYELYGSELVRNTIAWVFIFGILLVSIPFGRIFRSRFGKAHEMDNLTIPALVSVLVATGVFSVLTGMGNGLVRDYYGWVFGFLVFFQLTLGALFFAYEATLPALPHTSLNVGEVADRL